MPSRTLTRIDCILCGVIKSPANSRELDRLCLVHVYGSPLGRFGVKWLPPSVPGERPEMMSTSEGGKGVVESGCYKGGCVHFVV